MSSPHCSRNPMYRTTAEQKCFSRNAAKQFKTGTPTVQILREKCRQRIQEARRKRFDGSRSIEQTDDGNLINKIIHEAISGIDSDISLEDEVLKELRDDMSQWLLKQQEEEDDYFVQLIENNMVCCPLCLKSCLDQGDDKLIKCQCGATFKYCGTLSDLHEEMKDVAGRHEHLCHDAPIFFVEQYSHSLNVMCEKCNYFYTFG